jgi:hypothetical protein
MAILAFYFFPSLFFNFPKFKIKISVKQRKRKEKNIETRGAVLITDTFNSHVGPLPCDSATLPRFSSHDGPHPSLTSKFVTSKLHFFTTTFFLENTFET